MGYPRDLDERYPKPEDHDAWMRRVRRELDEHMVWMAEQRRLMNRTNLYLYIAAIGASVACIASVIPFLIKLASG